MSLEHAPVDETRGRVAAAVVLIIAGVVLYLLQSRVGLGISSFFFLVGAAFVAAYFYRGGYGFLVPGGILLGLGLDNLATVPSGYSFHELSPAGLGIGFVLIYLIGLIYRREAHWWPLIPGGVLIVTGLSSAGMRVSHVLSLIGPIALVLVGLAVLFGWVGRKKPEESP